MTHDNRAYVKRFVPEAVVVRWLSTRGVMVEPCASCIQEENDGYSACSELELGKGRWSSLTCTVAMVWMDEVPDWLNAR